MDTNRKNILLTLLLTMPLWLLSTPPCTAQDDGVSVSIIDDNVLRQGRGTIDVNQAAGNRNAQLNDTTVAFSNAGVAVVKENSEQRPVSNTTDLPSFAMARINDGAFSEAEGKMAINQASGQDNTQANGVAIALGIEGEITADATLRQTLPDVTPAGAGSTHDFQVSVADTAFRDASGIAQLNQSAGSGNTSANRFALRMSSVTN